MKKSLLILLTFFVLGAYGQNRKTRFPIWTFHQKNITINGVSVGLGSLGSDVKKTNTNGVKLEVIGAGIIIPLIPKSPIAQDPESFSKIQNDTISEIINGINLSASGTACNCVTNGVSFGLIGQIQYKINGLSATMLNFSQIHNGIQIGIANESYKMSGIQMGLFNRSKLTRGIQIGLWNVNERRKFPIVNWNFK
jgi:hypothetical protein